MYLNNKGIVLKKIVILLLLFMVQGCRTQDSCFLFESCITRESPLSLGELEEREYPLYLPSSETLDLLDLQEAPTISQRMYDELCEYVQIDYNSVDTTDAKIGVQISNGCNNAYITQDMYIDEFPLSWAENQKAYLLEKDNVRWLVLEEKTQGLRYSITSEKTLSETLLFLESMELSSAAHSGENDR